MTMMMTTTTRVRARLPASVNSGSKSKETENHFHYRLCLSAKKPAQRAYISYCWRCLHTKCQRSLREEPLGGFGSLLCISHHLSLSCFLFFRWHFGVPRVPLFESTHVGSDLVHDSVASFFSVFLLQSQRNSPCPPSEPFPFPPCHSPECTRVPFHPVTSSCCRIEAIVAPLSTFTLVHITSLPRCPQ